MPRKSHRSEKIEQMTNIALYCSMRRFASEVNSIGYDDTIDIEKMAYENLLLLLSNRYSLRRIYQVRESRFNLYRECDDKEFLRSFRMEKSSYYNLHSIIRLNNVFKSRSNRKMLQSKDQLLIFLKYIGTHGADACVENLSSMFGVSMGLCSLSINRVITALLCNYEEVVQWPSVDERKQMSIRIKEKFLFPNCIGFMDGTLITMAFKPKLNGEDYFTRKRNYSINALVICDDKLRVTYTLVGWPGSTHDNRVFSNSKVYQNSQNYFRFNEYLLVDTAYKPSQHIIPPFKNLAGSELLEKQKNFNKRLAKARVRGEHCIGLIKARFAFLKNVRIIIRSSTDLHRIIRVFMCAVMLHNYLLYEPEHFEVEQEGICNGDQPVDGELVEDEDREIEVEDIEYADQELEEIDLSRRDQLVNYLREVDGIV